MSRPVKLCLSFESDKWEFLRRFNAQKPGGAFARLDLAKEQQQKDFLLRKELRDARQKDEQGTYKIVEEKVQKLCH